ncbi:MAG: hypothetical protein LBS43_10790 [Prevotellaceae bacterium]|nr:hypothetical protein [Prevotellaceae bacterium]
MYDKITFVTQDEDELRIYQMREKAIYDYNSGMRAAELKGLQEGEKRGLQKGEKRGLQKGLQESEKRVKALFVINLQQLGFSLEEISKYTTLTAEEVAQILKEQNFT